MVEIRQIYSGEEKVLGHVMWNAIHSEASLYSEAQRKAWLAAPPKGPAWIRKLEAQKVWVAVVGASPVGFVTLAKGGYIDLAFVRSEAQGQGVFSALLVALEETARARKHPRLWTHASLMAEPAFAARGFYVTRRETVMRADQTLARAEMEKVLT